MQNFLIITGGSPNSSTVGRHAPPESKIDATFWTLLVFIILSPLVALAVSALCRQSMLRNFNFTKRQRHYDIRSLRRPEVRTLVGKLANILCYRPRPLPFEILKVTVELSILFYLIGFLGLSVLIVLWCIFDLAVGFQLLNYVYLKHTNSARGATKLAAYVYGGYCLLYGFPLGFVAKLIWIVWLNDKTSFTVIFIPFYIEAVASVIFVFFFMCPNICWRARHEGLKSFIHKIQLILLFMGFFVLWFFAYYNISICHGPPVAQDITRFDFNVFVGKCPTYFNSWTTSLLPLFLLVVLSLYILLWTILSEGMFYRFLPETLFLWSEAVVVVSCFHSLDTGDDRILLGAGALIGASVLGSVFTNLILLFDILAGLAAPVQPVSEDSATSAQREETKKRTEMREMILRDFTERGGRTSLKGTLLVNIRKRDRMRQCVVCFDDFRRGQQHNRKSMTTTVTEQSVEPGTAPDNVIGIIRACGHYFHFNCVWDWILRQSTCPLCRIDIQLTKEAIQTVNYEDVRYALAQPRTVRASKFGTVSEMIHSRSNMARDRDSIGSAMSFFSRKSTRSSNRDVDSDQVSVASSRRFPTLRKNCSICKEPFPTSRQAKDIVVGYLRACGHYYHCICIDKYIRKHERCHECHEQDSEAPATSSEQTPSTSSENPNYNRFDGSNKPGTARPLSDTRVTNADVVFAFLSDVHSDVRSGRKNLFPMFGENTAL